MIEWVSVKDSGTLVRPSIRGERVGEGAGSDSVLEVAAEFGAILS